MEIAHALRDMRPARGIVITHRVPRMEDRSKNGETRRRSGARAESRRRCTIQFKCILLVLTHHARSIKGTISFQRGVFKGRYTESLWADAARVPPALSPPPRKSPFGGFFGSDIILSPSGFRRIDPRFNFYVFATALSSICWITPPPEAGTVPSRERNRHHSVTPARENSSGLPAATCVSHLVGKDGGRASTCA